MGALSGKDCKRTFAGGVPCFLRVDAPFFLTGFGGQHGVELWNLSAHGTKRKKLWLAAGLIINLGALIYFKYAKGVSALPLGISFFTFTQIAFLMEAYGGKLHKVPILSYGLYVSFFPKIMQGPIALPGEMLPQFEKRDTRVSWEKIYKSFYLFVLGLSKKVLLADTFGKAADFGYANLSGLNTWDGIIVMLSYTLQLYFDFGGY